MRELTTSPTGALCAAKAAEVAALGDGEEVRQMIDGVRGRTLGFWKPLCALVKEAKKQAVSQRKKDQIIPPLFARRKKVRSLMERDPGGRHQGVFRMFPPDVSRCREKENNSTRPPTPRLGPVRGGEEGAQFCKRAFLLPHSRPSVP